MTNNQAEYEAFLAGLRLAKDMEAEEIKIFTDSQLVASQVSGEYQTKDERLTEYLALIREKLAQFKESEVKHVPREHNSRADVLSKLASTRKRKGGNQSLIQETPGTIPNSLRTKQIPDSRRRLLYKVDRGGAPRQHIIIQCEVKGKWTEELHSVPWSYRTTPHSTTRETPFRLTYGTEAVIPVETGASSFRAEIPVESELNNEMLREELDLLEELRDG
ncbi:RNA-directed DNA polymerase (Reverse transcriptase), partial [Trifolium medium]|nr:RNA-directed DNA polymerase (Reverse transcriptase) [Trifolium medium]